MEENKPSPILTELFEKYGWYYNDNVRAFQHRFDELYLRQPKVGGDFIPWHEWLCLYLITI